jgi:hypothetical protein
MSLLIGYLSSFIFVLRFSRVRIPALRQITWLRLFHDFHQSLQISYTVVSKNRPRSLSSTSFPIHLSQSSYSAVRSQVLIAMSIKITVFCDIAPCSLVEIDGNFRHRPTYWLNHQDPLVLMMEAVSISETSVSTRLHGSISNNTVTFPL